MYIYKVWFIILFKPEVPSKKYILIRPCVKDKNILWQRQTIRLWYRSKKKKLLLFNNCVVLNNICLYQGYFLIFELCKVFFLCFQDNNNNWDNTIFKLDAGIFKFVSNYDYSVSQGKFKTLKDFNENFKIYFKLLKYKNISKIICQT